MITIPPAGRRVAARCRGLKSSNRRPEDGQAADALRVAKLAMIRARKPPVYWVPFILIGE
jgi:hypothetical protein